MNYLIETPRLFLRKIVQEDFEDLCKILKNPDVMYAWEHGFSDEEVAQWIEKNLIRYQNEGFSYFAVIEKNTQKFIGVAGPLIENIDGVSHIGIAYIFKKEVWGQGFATEAAKASMDYAFKQLGANQVIAEIRPENTASLAVANRLNMHQQSSFIKEYNGKKMLHLIFCITPKQFYGE